MHHNQRRAKNSRNNPRQRQRNQVRTCFAALFRLAFAFFAFSFLSFPFLSLSLFSFSLHTFPFLSTPRFPFPCAVTRPPDLRLKMRVEFFAPPRSQLCARPKRSFPAPLLAEKSSDMCSALLVRFASHSLEIRAGVALLSKFSAAQ